MGSFIPVTLEQLARENGYLQLDPTKPCPSSFDPQKDSETCVVHFLGLEINTASFVMYTFSISVLIQALLIISMSGAADHGRFRKTFLLWFAMVGSTATMLFLAVVPSLYVLGAVLAIVANTCFGASFVLLNSFLPLLVRYHPTVQFASHSDESSYLGDEDALRSGNSSLRREAQCPNELAEEDTLMDGVVDVTTALLPRSRSEAGLTVPNSISKTAPSRELVLSTKISSSGIAIGYIAALLVQTVSIVILIIFGSDTFGLRIVLFIIGLWWFVFTIPSAMWLRPRPGPPLHIQSSSTLGLCLAYFAYSWKSLGRTVMHARRLKDLILFLSAWFLLSDAIATVTGTAVLFAKTTLGMRPANLALINVIVTVTGVIGAFSWARISIFLGLKPSQTILACILLFEVIPLYALLSYIPAIRRSGSFGLQQQWEMYPLGAVYGFVLGGLSSYCRSLFGELIPPGFEAAFYALYAITDKGSSVFGPAIVGAITDYYGEIRPAFWFLAVLIAMPFPLMMFVNVERGRKEAIALAKELEDMSNPRHESDDDRLSEDLSYVIEGERLH
ncbi:MFS general substrate transporter [Pleomassaria siparia CBS 279.74]|uniref:Autophagy-related protein n=1 Tax=Pleomassaria siparia CBS 279.74 TaxID=1314801 RepID=A0A6G1JUY9_9PLEO|nr:MFS general substrate transporter [Pleomassaria siparia CBS 279.74]